MGFLVQKEDPLKMYHTFQASTAEAEEKEEKEGKRRISTSNACVECEILLGIISIRDMR